MLEIACKIHALLTPRSTWFLEPARNALLILIQMLRTRTVLHAIDKREKSSLLTVLAKRAKLEHMLVQRCINASLMCVKKVKSSILKLRMDPPLKQKVMIHGARIANHISFQTVIIQLVSERSALVIKRSLKLVTANLALLSTTLIQKLKLNAFKMIAPMRKTRFSTSEDSANCAHFSNILMLI